MLSRNPGHYLTLGGCLAFLLLAIPVLGQEAERLDVAPPSEQAEPSQADSELPPTDAAPVQEQPSPAVEQDALYDTERYAKANLTAQESIARSNEALARLTDLQITVSAIEAGLLALTIVFTAWAAFAASKAARAADRAVEVTREGIECELRAYIAMQRTIWAVPKEGTPEASKSYRLQIEWKNCGATPARRCRVSISRDFRTGSLPEDYEYPWFHDDDAMLAMETTLGPGQNCFSALHFTSEQASKVASGELDVFVWAWFEYSDVFKNSPRRRTEICMKVNIPHNLQHCNPTAFGPHNGADEDCYHKPKTA